MNPAALDLEADASLRSCCRRTGTSGCAQAVTPIIRRWQPVRRRSLQCMERSADRLLGAKSGEVRHRYGNVRLATWTNRRVSMRRTLIVSNATEGGVLPRGATFSTRRTAARCMNRRSSGLAQAAGAPGCQQLRHYGAGQQRAEQGGEPCHRNPFLTIGQASHQHVSLISGGTDQPLKSVDRLLPINFDEPPTPCTNRYRLNAGQHQTGTIDTTAYTRKLVPQAQMQYAMVVSKSKLSLAMTRSSLAACPEIDPTCDRSSEGLAMLVLPPTSLPVACDNQRECRSA